MSDPVQAEDAAALSAQQADESQFVTFAVAGEMFAVPMAPVQEIIRVPEVARLPLAPAALEGLANLRGRVLPIVSLRRLFGAEPRERDDATRAVVVDFGQPLGFVVDRVASVVSVDRSRIEDAAGVQGLVQADGLAGVIRDADANGANALTMIVDFERLIRDHFAAVQRAAARADAVASAATAAHADEAAASDELRLVSFTAAGQEYAIDIADVQEIVQVPPRVTALPNTPPHVLGVMTLRERLLPLLGLRALFGLAPQALEEQHRIVVVSLPGGAQVGLVTDAVKEVLSVPRSRADAVPPALRRDGGLQELESICRLEEGRRLVSVIAIARLLGLESVQRALAATGHETTENRMEHDTSRDTDDDLQVVVFRLGAEEFGVPIMSVQEIVRVPEALTRVPRTPAFVEGVINLRGTVLPVVDQRRRLGLPAIERHEGQRIMVYTLGGVRTGFIVDSVAEVLRIPRASVEAAPRLSDEQARLITQVAKLDGDRRLVMLIEPRQLLGAAEAGAIAQMGRGDDDWALPKAA